MTCITCLLLAGNPTTDEYLFGYEADLMVLGTSQPELAQTIPYLCAGVRVKRPANRPGELAFDLIDTARNNGFNVQTLVTDQGIAPLAKAESLQGPLYDLGVDLVMSYPAGNAEDNRNSDLGKRAGYQGIVWVEGHPYCAAMPEKLVNATVDYNAGNIDKSLLRERITARAYYLAKVHGKRRADGSQRYSHPKDAHGDHVCNPNRANAPLFCRQETLLVPREHLDLKRLQKYRYGTPQWAAIYRANRSTNEGYNGYIKDAGKENLGAPLTRRIRGLAAHAVATAMNIVSANMRRIHSFLARSQDDSEVVESKRRTRAEKQRQRDIVDTKSFSAAAVEAALFLDSPEPAD